MATKDSRHNIDTPRWGYTLGDVQSGFVTEPPGQKKDDGWEPGVDVPVGGWWNWLHQQASHMIEYLENYIGLEHLLPQVLRGEKGTGAGDVTAGVGLSVDVASARVLIQGFMYQPPAETNLALAAADPTDSRYDIVAARLNAGIPEYYVIEGTPDPSPAEPAVPADQVPIARITVPATATVPGQIRDLRQFGLIGADTIVIDEDLDVGTDGDTLRVRHNGGAGATITMFDNDSGLPILNIADELVWLVGVGPLSFANVTGDITFPATQVKFDTPITGIYEIGAADIRTRLPGQSATGLGLGSGDEGVTQQNTSNPTYKADAVVRVPKGATITDFRVYGIKANTELFVKLFTITKADNTRSQIASTNTIPEPNGNFEIGASFSHLKLDARHYYLEFEFEGTPADATAVWGAEVEYTLPQPWDSF